MNDIEIHGEQVGMAYSHSTGSGQAEERAGFGRQLGHESKLPDWSNCNLGAQAHNLKRAACLIRARANAPSSERPTRVDAIAHSAPCIRNERTMRKFFWAGKEARLRGLRLYGLMKTQHDRTFAEHAEQK